MGIHKTLLYPFSVNSSYFEGYAWAFELALRLNARLQLFTVSHSDEEAVYQSLLAAHGYYLHHFKHDPATRSRILREQYIVTGVFREELAKHLKNNPVDIMIIDTAFQAQHSSHLKDIVKESNGAIILSNNPVYADDSSVSSITDHFYNQLRNAEFYKIPENFFSSLGHDQTVFNYLRSFFQKSTN